MPSPSSSFLPPSSPAVPPALPVAAYTLSSQSASWSFSSSTLSALRSAAWRAARARLSAQWAAEARLASSASTTPTPTPTPAPEFPREEQLAMLVTSYLGKLRGLTKVLGVPGIVEEYAAAYMKRYFVRRSELEADVKGVMLTAVYLSLKSTSHALPLSRFSSLLAGRGPNARTVAGEIEAAVRSLEFGVADALGWELILHTPGEALRGAVLDMQTLHPSPLPLLRKLLPRAQTLLSLARLTRLELSYSASHIALACLYGAGSASAASSSSGSSGGNTPSAGADAANGNGESSGASAEAASEAEAHALVRRWLEAKEAAARRAHEARKKEREEWDAAQTGRGKKNGGAGKDEDAPASTTSAADEASSTPLGLSIPSILGILSSILSGIAAQERAGEAARKNAPEGAKGPFVVDIEAVRNVDAALKRCRDPEGVEGTEMYKRKRASEDAALASKRARKAEAVAAAQGPDPFGSAPLLAPSALDGKPKDGGGGGGGGGGLFGKEIAKRKREKEWDSDEEVPVAKGAVKQ